MMETRTKFLGIATLAVAVLAGCTSSSNTATTGSGGTAGSGSGGSSGLGGTTSSVYYHCFADICFRNLFLDKNSAL
jgi:Spy/CpxP family protein refolding chaperone